MIRRKKKHIANEIKTFKIFHRNQYVIHNTNDEIILAKRKRKNISTHTQQTTATDSTDFVSAWNLFTYSLCKQQNTIR